MKHYGDITKINGAAVPVVDIITGGSPCQDLSVAGKRAGLTGQRSGLFMEQIRVIKEMRKADEERGGRTDKLIRPRYMVWENVPGALSSNNGEDFRIVLEETARIADESAVVPRPEGGRKWTNSGCIMGDGWSLAWRIHDAQFWGVPQRRRRIALVADFGGQSAPEILFERESVSGDITESREEGKAVTRDVRASTNSASSNTISFQERAGKPGGGKGILIQNERTGALSTVNNQYVCQNINGNDISGTLDGHYCLGCGARGGVEREVVAVYDTRGNGNGNISPTITGDHQNSITDYTAICVNNLGYAKYLESETAEVLRASGGDNGGGSEILIFAIDCRNGSINKELNNTLESSGSHNLNSNNVVYQTKAVRRLTPLECERLQCYPDGWTDIGDWTDTKGKKRKLSDTARYKALGNSIALPFWEWMAKRICAQYDRPATMASLFDGIGGFPLVFSRCGCDPVWASEIEEFPIAVTKVRFGDE